MASRNNTENMSTWPNQPHSQEVQDSTTSSNNPFEVPFDLISSQSIEQYPLEIPTKPTIYLSYTSSHDIPHQESSSNEELWGVTLEEPLNLIPKIEVNQLHHRTRVYLKPLGQIPIIYQIPRSRVSQRRTQPYRNGEILTASLTVL